MSEMTLNNNLKEIRELKGLTQQELAEKTDVSRQTIITIERHFCDPSTSLSLRIAKVLEVSVEEIFKVSLEMR